MPSREGGARSFVVVARDVTAELETEQLKSDFVATVSHELRSPLTPLKGFVRALRDGLIEETPEARHEYYEIMWRAVERLERLINDLLDVSRVEAGKLDLESKPFNVTELVDGCIRHIRSAEALGDAVDGVKQSSVRRTPGQGGRGGLHQHRAGGRVRQVGAGGVRSRQCGAEEAWDTV